jgi:hypothetical protein
VLFFTQEFLVAVAFNLPAVLLLLCALIVSYQHYRRSGLFVIACALVLSIFAALLQQLRVGLHAVYFDHNVLYHLLQAVVLYLLFLGARRLSCAS